MLQKEWVRSQLPATSATTYLNNGTYGPLPHCAYQAIAAAARLDTDKGRIGGGMAAFLDYQAERTALRQSLGRLVGADHTEIALTRSTTEGINIGLWGRTWSAGDEVVTTSQEHAGVLVPLAVLHARCGVKVTLADIGGGETDRTLEAMSVAIRPGVKMVVLSHVLYTTGAVLPLQEITTLAHAVGATVHVDGAQSVGAIAVDVRGIGVDTYAFSGQKWLCGPDSSGGLYVAPDQMNQLDPTSVSFTTIDFQQFDPRRPLDVTLNPSAARYETGTMYRPAVKGFATSIQWLTVDVGLTEIFADIKDLSTYCRQQAAQLPGVRVLTPFDQTSGLVSFQIDQADVDDAVAYLAQAGISIRSIHESHALRISTGFYNTREEIDRTLRLVRRYIQSQ